MLLWTIQHEEVYIDIVKKGYYIVDPKNSFCYDKDGQSNDLKYSYDWISNKMEKKGITKPENVTYPIWAWYTWEGKRKRRDMRSSGYAPKGTKILLLTLEVPDTEVLLSDFDLWHFPLNDWYIPTDKQEEENYDLLLNKYVNEDLENIDQYIQFNREMIINIEDRKNFDDMTINSWDNIFNIEGYNYVLEEQSYKRSTQATFWILKKEHILKMEKFIAK